MVTLRTDTVRLLDDIERRIDEETEEEFADSWRRFLEGKFEGEYFSPCRKTVSESTLDIPPVGINDAIGDYDLMLRHQMQGVSYALSKPDLNLAIRANYGTGIMSSLFGAEIYIMPEKMNILPTTRPLAETEVMRGLLDKGVPSLENGFGKDVFFFGEFVREVFSHYPKIAKYVTVYHPDSQWPLDIAELLWGCEMFYAMYDKPDLVQDVMRLITDTYIAFMDKWYGLYPLCTDINPHWAKIWHRGGILLRDDSAMNLSPDAYREFAAPYDQELLRRFCGGAIHFCGKGDHYIHMISEFEGLYGVNMSQPQYNDMETIFRHTVDKGIFLHDLRPAYAEAGVKRGLRGRVSI